MLAQTHTASSRSACRGRAQRGQLAFSAPRPISQRSGSLIQQAPSMAMRVTVAAGKLDSVSLFGGDTASLMGGSQTVEKKKSGKEAVMEVQLSSTAGIDYTVLRDHLANGAFREAEDETRALLIKLAGPEAVKRNWVYFTEVKNISVTDFQTLDNLWKASSNNKFGYSVQKEIWVQNQKRWPKFFKQIDWTQGENNNYRKWPMEFIYSMDAPRGHLPLTNALRGTQLFQAIMEHPAFEKSSTAKTLDQKAAEAAGRTQSLF